MEFPVPGGPRALARPPHTQGSAFPEEPQPPPGFCAESSQPRPASGPTRPGGRVRGQDGGGGARTVSIRTPEVGPREGRGGRAGRFPGPGPAQQRRPPAGRSPGQASVSAFPVRAARRPGRRRRPAREAGRARRTRAGGCSWAGRSRRGPGPRPPRAQHAGGPTRLPAPSAPAGPASLKGLALSPGLLLPGPPFAPQPGRCCSRERRRGSGPGRMSPCPPRPPLYAVGAPPVLRAQGPGPGLGLPFSPPRRGRGGAPRSPRQVREGCVDSFSCGERVAPQSGPFCSLYFILKLYLMLLYERGGAGRELSQSPLRANVLFIKRVSEISCAVVDRIAKKLKG